MHELPVCAYCGTVVDPTKPYWIVERWECGRVVARGAAGHPGCLHAIAAFQGPARDAAVARRSRTRRSRRNRTS
jgi:hypothetical protein